MVDVADEATLAEVGAAVRETGVEVLVVGRGSNLLVAEAGFAGVAVMLEGDFVGIEIDGVTVRAGAAATLPVVARRTAAAGIDRFRVGGRGARLDRRSGAHERWRARLGHGRDPHEGPRGGPWHRRGWLGAG